MDPAYAQQEERPVLAWPPRPALPVGYRLELTTHGSLAEIGEAAWDSLLGPDDPPFLRYAFLEAFEATGCVRAEVGWLPAHLAVRDGQRLVAAAPAYVKGNSDGEFIFDHSWAKVSYEHFGVPYYPKLLVAVPFTPATGPRLLVAPGVDRGVVLPVLIDGLRALTAQWALSGAHVLLAAEAEVSALAGRGFGRRFSLQHHWLNRDYSSFDDFLARYKAKKRHQIRRERRALVDEAIRIEVLEGRELTEEAVELAFTFYQRTVDKFFWGRRYLNREFFQRVCERMPEQVQIVLAREAATGRALGGAFNLRGRGALYGRYWGAVEERPFLHFNVCYYTGIEYCIAHGLALFEPGAGGEHKLVRGFEPTLTQSAHWLRDDRLGGVIDNFLERERRALSAYLAAYEADPLLRRD